MKCPRTCVSGLCLDVCVAEAVWGAHWAYVSQLEGKGAALPKNQAGGRDRAHCLSVKDSWLICNENQKLFGYRTNSLPAYTVCSHYSTHCYNKNFVTSRFEFGLHIFSMEIVLHYRPTTFSFTRGTATWDTWKWKIKMPLRHRQLWNMCPTFPALSQFCIFCKIHMA